MDFIVWECKIGFEQRETHSGLCFYRITVYVFFFFSNVKYFREVRAEVESLVRRLIAVIQVRDGWVAWTSLVEVEVVRSELILDITLKIEPIASAC